MLGQDQHRDIIATDDLDRVFGMLGLQIKCSVGVTTQIKSNRLRLSIDR
jgi:hypothetical protein